MAAIKSLHAKEILDSQGNPALQTTLELDTGLRVESSVPNGAKHHPQEAAILLDQNPGRMGGKGVQKAVAFINQTLGPQLAGQDPSKQAEIDQYLIQLDGTNQKTQLGANTLTGVSQVVLKAAAGAAGVPVYQYLLDRYRLADRARIPTSLFGLINGGQYGSGNLDIQEFIVIPASHIEYSTALEIENTLRQALQQLLKEKKANYATGALGGFTPFLQKNSGVFELIVEAARKTPYILSRDFFFGIDSGAENLLERSKYSLRDKPSSYYSERELLDYYLGLRERYNLTYFEDPFIARDTNAWKSFVSELGGTARVAGDVITATNPELVAQAIENKYCDTLVAKPSQIGTITETIEAIKQAKVAGWGIVVSQRTGETNDDFLADFAVGVGADFVKFGPVNRGEAVAKYNRLSDIATGAGNGTAVSPTPVAPPTPPTTPAEPEAPVESAVPIESITPVEPEVPATVTSPEPVAPETAAPTVIQAVETLPGAPQNTFIAQLQPEPLRALKPAAEKNDPLAAFIKEIPPASLTPLVPDPSPLKVVAAEPPAPTEPTAAATPVPSVEPLPMEEKLPEPDTAPVLPPPTEPVADTPSSAANDHSQLEAASQQAIDSTLAELGAMAPAGQDGEMKTPSDTLDSSAAV
jgi:enolase